MDDPGLPLTPLVDGALVPCWNWRDQSGLYSGKHHRTGLLDHFPDTPPMADKGCTGLGMITPERKPVGGELTETQKQYHKVINTLRAPVGRAIANLKPGGYSTPATEDHSAPSPRPSRQSSHINS